jgi:Cys-tRNA(Pro)/Cys-tRNA(Cys) deacylase
MAVSSVSEVEMIGPLDIHQHLLAHDIRHEIVRVRRAAPTAAQLPDALSIGPERCVLAHLFVASGLVGAKSGEEQLVLVLATADVDATDRRVVDAVQAYLLAHPGALRGGRRPRKALRQAITVVPAAPELVSSRTDYLASHLAPLLLPADVLVVAVPYLAELGSNIVYTATGDGGTALALRATDLVDASNAKMLGPIEEPDTIVLDPPIAPTSTSRLAALSSKRSAPVPRAELTRTAPQQSPSGRRALRSNRASWTPTEQS